MAGGKLKAVKKTMKFLVQQMSAEDRLSIVTFSDDVRFKQQATVLSQITMSSSVHMILPKAC